MRKSLRTRKNGTVWAPQDNFDVADDSATLSKTRAQVQEKTSLLNTISATVRLNIHVRKTKILKETTPVTLRGTLREEVTSFRYLGSIADQEGGTEAD